MKKKIGNEYVVKLWIRISKKLDEQLWEIAQREGTYKAEIFRRMVDLFGFLWRELEKSKKRKMEWEEFRREVEQAVLKTDFLKELESLLDKYLKNNAK